MYVCVFLSNMIYTNIYIYKHIDMFIYKYVYIKTCICTYGKTSFLVIVFFQCLLVK